MATCLLSLYQVIVEGRQQPAGCHFMVPTSSGCLSLLGVEQFAIHHYSTMEAWPRAVHAEGATFSFLFVLLMWDEVFSLTVPDMFRGAFQVSTAV